MSASEYPFAFGIQLEANATYPPQVTGVALGAVLSLVALGVFDFFVARHTKARWFAVHAVANAYVVFFAFGDMLRVLADPFLAGLGPYSLLPLQMIIAVHAYHMIAFNNLRQEDYVHHILFACLMGGFACVDTFGPITNFVAFFVSGLPGGLDYCMLVAVKHGWMDALTEKVWATRLNVWMRSPGLQIGSLLLYSIAVEPATRSHYRHGFTTYIALVTSALTFLNGTFYMQQVALVTARKDENFTC